MANSDIGESAMDVISEIRNELKIIQDKLDKLMIGSDTLGD